jgi:hypothetical protein
MAASSTSIGERVTQARIGVRSARLRSRLPRYVASAVALILMLAGLRAIVAPPQAAAPVGPAPTRDPAAEDFALQFARAYLTYDAARPAARERALAPFLPHELDPDAGLFPARGSQQVTWAEVASNQLALAGGRVITVAAQTDTQPQPLYLAVTVRHDPGHPLALVGYPSLVGAPSVATDEAAPARAPVEDPAVTEVVTRVVGNYLAGNAQDLAADLTPDAAVTLPTLAVTVQSTDQVVWTGSSPGSGAVLATVTAADGAGTNYRLTYELGIARPDGGERPYVDFVEVVPTSN